MGNLTSMFLNLLVRRMYLVKKMYEINIIINVSGMTKLPIARSFCQIYDDQID